MVIRLQVGSAHVSPHNFLPIAAKYLLLLPGTRLPFLYHDIFHVCLILEKFLDDNAVLPLNC